MSGKIWFITGISSGLGKALARSVVDNGAFVIGTFRNQHQADEFNRFHHDKALGLKLNVTQTIDIEAAFEIVKRKFGHIDVLVNNAGYGLAGAIEETSIEEAREIFEANFFGALKVTQTFLPMLRKARKGHIIQVSSHGGFKAFAGFGIYNASKFALEGFSEALAQEIAPLGIKLTIAEPGPFRTNFAGTSFRYTKITIDAYKGTAGAFKERMRHANGKQEGDPEKAAKAIFDMTQLDTPPLRLPLGKIAVASLLSKIDNVKADIDNHRQLAERTVF